MPVTSRTTDSAVPAPRRRCASVALGGETDGRSTSRSRIIRDLCQPALAYERRRRLLVTKLTFFHPRNSPEM